MKNLVVNISIIIGIIIGLSSCATIVSGSKYNALIDVEGHPEAKVYIRGYGEVNQMEFVELKRHGKKRIIIEEEGCERMTKVFGKKANYAIIGNLPFAMLLGSGIDAITGALFSPVTGEEVVRTSQGHFEYVISDFDEVCHHKNK